MTVYVVLQGGLGNQMFQLAMGTVVGHCLGRDVHLLDYWLKRTRYGVTRRAFNLHPFGRVPANSIPKTIDLTTRLSEAPIVGRFSRRFFPHILSDSQALEPSALYKYAHKPYLVLCGFWQNQPSVFEKFRPLIKDTLTPLASDQVLWQPPDRATIAIHVRRGDYVTNSNAFKQHGVLPLSYYYRAINLLKQCQAVEQIDVFSDDPYWCASNLRLEIPTVFKPMNGDPLLDLLQMSRYSGLVIANSSYSWWAAWLGESSVVAPKDWSTSASEIYLPKPWLLV